MRAARTPPEPAPMTNRSKSNLAIAWRLPARSSDTVVRADEADALGPGDDGEVSDADEHAVLHHAGDQLQRLVEVLGLVDAAEVAIEDVFAAVGDERLAVAAGAQLDLALAACVRRKRNDHVTRRGEAEAHDLHGQREGAERRHALG